MSKTELVELTNLCLIHRGDDLDTLLDVMLSPSLTEFQYLVDDDWTVQLR